MIAGSSRLAARRPILVNFEDAGLLDPSTLALLGRLIERAQTMAILVIITFRPSFDPPWAGYPHVTPIRLDYRYTPGTTTSTGSESSAPGP